MTTLQRETFDAYQRLAESCEAFAAAQNAYSDYAEANDSNSTEGDRLTDAVTRR